MLTGGDSNGVLLTSEKIGKEEIRAAVKENHGDPFQTNKNHVRRHRAPPRRVIKQKNNIDKKKTEVR